MAEFITKCPHCNVELQAQDEWIGMEVECPECQKTFIIPKKSGGKVELAQEKKTGSSPETTASNSSFTSSDCFWFIAILIGIPLLLYWWIDWPRTVFWCTLPLWGFCLILLYGDNKGKLAIAALAGVIWWGWNAHTRVEIPTPKETVKTSSSNTADSSSEKSHQTHESKISVSVTVTKLINYGEVWKYNCEYRLYADDQLIATKNSTSMTVHFKVKVEKGASLRAEMLGKNGFGAITDTLEGPLLGKTATANYAGESIAIECM